MPNSPQFFLLSEAYYCANCTMVGNRNICAHCQSEHTCLIQAWLDKDHKVSCNECGYYHNEHNASCTSARWEKQQ